MNNDYHTPVLAETVLSLLQPIDGGVYVDATLGGGGHAEAILRASAPSGRVIGFDADDEALQFTKKRLIDFSSRVQYVHDNFSHMTAALSALNISGVNGILFDLGVSSRQLDSAERGFSFQREQNLDMRMDRRQHLDARMVVNTYDEKTLADIFWRYGEEQQARRVARQVVRARVESPIETTERLAAIVGSVAGGKFLQKSLARVFQAIRIEVNGEMENLRRALASGSALLGRGGRMVVISYHSLEDRIVKEFFKEHARTSIPSGHKYLPDRLQEPDVAILTRKPIVATDEEVGSNPRSRSAKLRAAEKR
jgi:16S rRNA (cytosine1402-N4)-methyltransferase